MRGSAAVQCVVQWETKTAALGPEIDQGIGWTLGGRDKLRFGIHPHPALACDGGEGEP